MTKILYVSLLDWFFTKQRPQHIAELLSDKYQVIYLCRTSWINKHNRKHKSNDKFKHIVKVNSNMKVFRIKLIPLQRINVLQRINHFIFRIIVYMQYKIYKPSILWLTHPNHVDIIPRKYNGKIVYDCMDNYSAFTNNKISSNSICKKEKLLCDKANLIFTSSGGLYKKIIGYTSENKVKIIKNGTDFEMFNNYYNSDSNKKRPQELKIDHKIIGYFGGISNWFDVDLIFSLSRNFSDCEIVIIGPINNNDLVEKAQNINNITLTGARNYSDLPKYLFHYDVCIMPFIINDLIKDVNPVKLYEYLSMGKPVVAPFYDEISEFGDLIYLAISQQDFIDKVKLSLNETNNDWVKQIRIEFAKQNSWSSRVNSICKELVDLDISNVM